MIVLARSLASPQLRSPFTRPGRVRATCRLHENVASRQATLLLDDVFDRELGARRVSNFPMIVLSKAALEDEDSDNCSQGTRFRDRLCEKRLFPYFIDLAMRTRFVVGRAFARR